MDQLLKNHLSPQPNKDEIDDPNSPIEKKNQIHSLKAPLAQMVSLENFTKNLKN